MTERKFTPPTEFPTDYIDGIGRKVTIYVRGHGQQPLLGQYSSGAMVSFDLDGYYGITDEDYDLHDIPKRIMKWHNVYDSGICSFGYSSREMADKYAEDHRVCVYCITCNPDCSNPEISMEDVV